MTNLPTLARVRDAAVIVQNQSTDFSKAVAALHEAIFAAHEDGASVREIARAAALSPARIHQIISLRRSEGLE